MLCREIFWPWFCCNYNCAASYLQPAADVAFRDCSSAPNVVEYAGLMLEGGEYKSRFRGAVMSSQHDYPSTHAHPFPHATRHQQDSRGTTSCRHVLETLDDGLTSIARGLYRNSVVLHYRIFTDKHTSRITAQTEAHYLTRHLNG